MLIVPIISGSLFRYIEGESLPDYHNFGHAYSPLTRTRRVYDHRYQYPQQFLAWHLC